jgi:hypothetical protein
LIWRDGQLGVDSGKYQKFWAFTNEETVEPTDPTLYNYLNKKDKR